MKSNLTPKNRKRLARLEREVKELYDLAYKHDLDESFAEAGEKLNSRVEQKEREIEKLKKQK